MYSFFFKFFFKVSEMVFTKYKVIIADSQVVFIIILNDKNASIRK